MRKVLTAIFVLFCVSNCSQNTVENQSQASLDSPGISAVNDISDNNSHEKIELLLEAAKKEDYASVSDQLDTIGPDDVGALTILIKELENPNEIVRAYSALALGKIGPSAKNAISPLLTMLKNAPIPKNSEDYFTPRAWNSAVMALSQIGMPAVPYLIAALNDEDEIFKSGVVSALARINNATPVLIEELKNKNNNIRKGAITALSSGQLGDTEKSSMILDALNHQNEWVQLGIIETIINKDRNSNRVRKHLIKIMAHRKSVFRTEAIKITRITAVEEKWQIPYLIELLDDNDAEVRYNAILLIRNRYPKDVGNIVPKFIEMLKDPDTRIRRTAASVLTFWGPEIKSAIPILISMLSSEDMYEIIMAMAALGAVGADAKEAIPLLIEKCNDENYQIRGNAASKLGLISKDSEKVVSILIKLLSHEHHGTQTEAAIGLGNIGPFAEKALPEIYRLLEKKKSSKKYDPWIVGKIEEAIRKIEGKE